MAKRYIRINWQNRPNVATPISATNLNKMDKGIDDIDNAIEEIYNKRVSNVVTTNPDTFLAGPVGKTLQDQITTLNNNLAKVKENYEPVIKGIARTPEQLDAILDDTSMFEPNSIYEYVVDVKGGLALGPGYNIIRGYKYAIDTYGWQSATLYSPSGIAIKYRSKIEGVWTEWVNK